MNHCSWLDCFASEWVCYLEQHGHRVTYLAEWPGTLASVKGRGRRYRWLLKCVEGDSILLTPSCRKDIRTQDRLARRARQECFVVVKFGQPGGSAIVIPAGEAVRARRLDSTKGAIPWDC